MNVFATTLKANTTQKYAPILKISKIIYKGVTSQNGFVNTLKLFQCKKDSTYIEKDILLCNMEDGVILKDLNKFDDRIKVIVKEYDDYFILYVKSGTDSTINLSIKNSENISLLSPLSNNDFIYTIEELEPYISPIDNIRVLNFNYYNGWNNYSDTEKTEIKTDSKTIQLTISSIGTTLSNGTTILKIPTSAYPKKDMLIPLYSWDKMGLIDGGFCILKVNGDVKIYNVPSNAQYIKGNIEYII